jgi:selenocysteine-specific translation elongation factor
MTRELGETVVMLDSLDVSKGIAVTSFYATPDQITAIIKETSLASFIIGKRDPGKMLQVLKNFDTARDSASPVMVVVDHSFSVKGVGEVILGFVKKGRSRGWSKGRSSNKGRDGRRDEERFRHMRFRRR